MPRTKPFYFFYFARTLVGMYSIFFATLATAQINNQSNATNEPSANHLTISEARSLLDRAVSVFNTNPLQLNNLKLVADTYAASLLRLSPIQDAELAAILAQTSLSIGWAYQSKANDPTSASMIYAEARQRWGRRNEPEVARYMANLSLQYSFILERFQAEQALLLHDQEIAHYATISDSRIQASVISFLDAKARLQIRLGRIEEGLATFNRTQSTYPNPTDLALITAILTSGFAQGDIMYTQLGQRDEVVTRFSKLLQTWDSREEPAIQTVLAYVASRLASHESGYGSAELALRLYEDLLRRSLKFKISSLSLSARSNIAMLLFKQMKYSESLESCDQFLTLYPHDSELSMHTSIARVMLLKAANLQALLQPQAAVKIYDEVLQRFKTSKAPQISLLIDEAERDRQTAVKNGFLLQRGMLIRPR